MNTKIKIDHLWEDFRIAINSAYERANKDNTEGVCLRDYAENISWSDSLASLLGRETANERQHRRNRPSVPGFAVGSASKLILMSQAASAANRAELPNASLFLTCRQTAVEAQVIGYFAAEFLKPEWREAVNSLDYAELMKVE